MKAEAELSVLVARWPIGGIGGKHLTTVGIDIQAPQRTIGDELVGFHFDSNGLTPFTDNELDSFMRSFFPFIERSREVVVISHDGKDSGVVFAAIPRQANPIRSTELTHATPPIRSIG